jgi:hypothetical protein
MTNSIEQEIQKFKGMKIVCCNESACDVEYLAGFANRLIAENEELKKDAKFGNISYKEARQAIADVKKLGNLIKHFQDEIYHSCDPEEDTNYCWMCMCDEVLESTKHYDE